MLHLQEHKFPEKGFESPVLEEETMHLLRDLANMEKACKVLTGEWESNEIYPDYNGVDVLFHIPPGTGKTHSAEALAYETGRTLKLVNYAQVVSMWVGGTEKALEVLFKGVADSKSILLFDEADALFASSTTINTSNNRFLNTETDVLFSLIE